SNLVAHRPTLEPQLVVRLQVHPQLLGGPEVSSETDRRIRGDPPLAVHDLVDPAWWHTDGHGKLVLRDPEALDEILHQDLSRMDRLDQVALSGSRRVRHCPHLPLSRRSRDAIAR